VTVIERDDLKIKILIEDWEKISNGLEQKIKLLCLNTDFLFVAFRDFMSIDVVITWLVSSLTPLIALKIASLHLICRAKALAPKLILFTQGVTRMINEIAEKHNKKKTSFIEANLFTETMSLKDMVYDDGMPTDSSSVTAKERKHLFSASHVHQIMPRHEAIPVCELTLWQLAQSCCSDITEAWKCNKTFSTLYFTSGLINYSESSSWKIPNIGIKYSGLILYPQISSVCSELHFKDRNIIKVLTANDNTFIVEKIRVGVTYFMCAENVLCQLHRHVLLQLFGISCIIAPPNHDFWLTRVKTEFENFVQDGDSTKKATKLNKAKLSPYASMLESCGSGSKAVSSVNITTDIIIRTNHCSRRNLDLDDSCSDDSDRLDSETSIDFATFNLSRTM
jgi:hypothetical protein